MAVTLEQAKNYLKVDEDITDDDELISSLISAASDYVERTTGKMADGSPLCELCVKQLVAHWYENRAVYSSKPGAINVLPHTVTALLTHIAQCEAYPEAGKT
ncbi:head-tail connector protein [Phascolarctobacterium succinatutens]|uniref:head-tail connector protein n=1 Tax=Phascolarctobacterium succinatutens TaxID=626940 RepID=UPI0026E98160|nr:head-tail connector protein [Phascolarctobacterium succinatutens]